jgi:hypothetical protein
MFTILRGRSRLGHRTRLFLIPLVAAALTAMAVLGAGPAAASAATPTVELGTAAAYSVLGGQAVTNTGPTTLSGDLGVTPGTATTGFPPGIVGGSRHSADAAAGIARSDFTIAYDDAAGRASTHAVAGDLVGRTLVDGVYTASGPLALSGTLTFDGQGDPNSVFIVQVASTLITATASHVVAINGAQACHIFWQVGSSATLGTASTFQGTVMASASVSVTTSVHIKGRVSARTGSVTLDNDVFSAPDCTNTVSPEAASATTTTITVPSSAPAGSSVVVGAAVSSSGGPVTGSVVFYDNGVPIGTAAVDSTGHARITVPAGGKLGSGTIVAVYSGSPAAAPSRSAGFSFAVRPAAVTTAHRPAPSAVRTSSPAVLASSPALASTGPRSVLPLAGSGGIALLFGMMLLFASRARYVGRRRR